MQKEIILTIRKVTHVLAYMLPDMWCYLANQISILIVFFNFFSGFSEKNQTGTHSPRHQV